MSLKELAVDDGIAINADTFAVLPIEMIVASTTNPRKVFNLPRLQELAESIKASGVHQPVLVRPLPPSRLQETFEGRRKGDPLPTHELIAGERRFRASKLAGAKTIPAMVRMLTDAQVLEVQLIENLQRDDLHPMEEAEGYELLCKSTGVTKEDIGTKVGKSRGYVYARLKLLNLTAAAREAFYADKIDASRGLIIARIPDAALQQRALDHATKPDWQGSVPSFRAFVSWAQQNVMLKLGMARFKITDASLVPSAGSCNECPKRTGAEPDLFADVESADVCIDPSCFHAKEAAHEEAVLAVAKAKGQRIITEREAKKLWDWEGGKIDGYVRIDRPDARVGGTKMLKTVLGKEMPEPILMQNPHKNGELIEVLPADKVTKMLKDSGRISPQQARSDRVISDHEAKRNALAKFEKTWRKRAITTVHAEFAGQVADNGSISGDVCRAIARDLLSGLRGDERQHVCELLGLGKVADAAAIESHIAEADPIEAEQVMLLLLMQHDLLQLVSYGDGAAMPARRIEAVAENYAVAIQPIKDAVRAEFEEAARPKKATATAAGPEAVKPTAQKKSTAPPAAQTRRGKKSSKEEVAAQVAEAFQAIEDEKNQAPDGAKLEEVAADAAASTTPDADVAPVAEVIDQAPLGAHEEEAASAAGDVAAKANEAPVETNMAPATTQTSARKPTRALSEEEWPFPKTWTDSEATPPNAVAQLPAGADPAESATATATAAIELGVRVRVKESLAGSGGYEGRKGSVIGQVMGTSKWQVKFEGNKLGKLPRIASIEGDLLEVLA